MLRQKLEKYKDSLSGGVLIWGMNQVYAASARLRLHADAALLFMYERKLVDRKQLR